MNVLVVEDEKDLLDQYVMTLEDNGHAVVPCTTGEECMKIYNIELQRVKDSDADSPFDVVLLDYQLPTKNGLEVAKEILALNPHQRIIFASGYIQETFLESIKHLKQVTEIMKKPFSLQALINTIEDKEIYLKLEKLNVDIAAIKELDPTHAQIKAYLDVLSELQNRRTF